MSGNLCILVDDNATEALSIAAALSQQGFPFQVKPLSPVGGVNNTWQLVQRQRPQAVMVDVTLDTNPPVDSDRLAQHLVRRGIRTVFVTKDRDIVDLGDRVLNGVRLPVYFKRSLYTDRTTMESCVARLGGTPLLQSQVDYKERLGALKDKRFLGDLNRLELNELRELERKALAEEREEVRRARQRGTVADEHFTQLVALIRDITKSLESERRRKL